MKESAQAECRVAAYRLEIRDEATGQLVKVIVGDREANRIVAEYPDGAKEDLGAFN